MNEEGNPLKKQVHCSEFGNPAVVACSILGHAIQHGLRIPQLYIRVRYILCTCTPNTSRMFWGKAMDDLCSMSIELA